MLSKFSAGRIISVSAILSKIKGSSFSSSVVSISSSVVSISFKGSCFFKLAFLVLLTIDFLASVVTALYVFCFPFFFLSFSPETNF